MEYLVVVVLEERFSKYLMRKVPSRTEEVIMKRFGISYNTFRKIEAGAPIRRSLAARLETRLEEEWDDAKPNGGE